MGRQRDPEIELLPLRVNISRSTEPELFDEILGARKMGPRLIELAKRGLNAERRAKGRKKQDKLAPARAGAYKSESLDVNTIIQTLADLISRQSNDPKVLENVQAAISQPTATQATTLGKIQHERSRGESQRREAVKPELSAILNGLPT